LKLTTKNLCVESSN